ncbi:transposase [Carboxydochorda subterranea]|uniref:Mutator family transposase n=1 Tax=Carboxydichorda subterranea TaxID=3109565 RepID=A0ABZ1BVJ1_9FIRM|nr:transposase [Limnochorda sp. L945t]WRP16608.1 transposase [Limnochorda sp. L945t]
MTGLVLQLAVAALGEMMEAETAERVGPKGQHRRERPAYRHGHAHGWVVVLGRKVRIERPRARSKDGQEVVLDTYLWAQQDDCLTEAVMARLLHGVSTRGYRATLDGVEELPGKGVSRSRISVRFTQAMRQLLEERLAERLEDRPIVVLVVDGVRLGESTVVVVLGIDADGHKRLLGLREGATENEAVVKGLLQDLVERDLRYDQGLLVVMDGAKALRAAVRAVFGQQALVQRCQVHKKTNVLDHLPESAQAWVARKLGQAYREPDYAVAKAALERLADQLEMEHPGAADSLREGLDETLTLHRLGIPLAPPAF